MCEILGGYRFLIAGGKTFVGLPEAYFHYMIEGVCLSVCLFLCLSFRTNEILMNNSNLTKC